MDIFDSEEERSFELLGDTQPTIGLVWWYLDYVIKDVQDISLDVVEVEGSHGGCLAEHKLCLDMGYRTPNMTLFKPTLR